MITEIPVSPGSATAIKEEQNNENVTSLHLQALLHAKAGADNSPCLMLNGEKVSCTADLEIADDCDLLKQVSLVKDRDRTGFNRIKKEEPANSLFKNPGIAPGKKLYRKLTVAALWNIHRMRKQRVQRRFL
jgi:hypothetical protein